MTTVIFAFPFGFPSNDECILVFEQPFEFFTFDQFHRLNKNDWNCGYFNETITKPYKWASKGIPPPG